MLEINNNAADSQVEIDRHKSAIKRYELSRPVRTALEAGLFSEGSTFFDYGCGHGGDIKRIRRLGFDSSGWDPYYLPESEKRKSSIVNLGYVLNVIERPDERVDTLREAWSLTEQALLVSAQVVLDYLGSNVMSYGDGVITNRNTFQKVFKQEELKELIDTILDTDAVPAGLGMFFAFKDETKKEAFKASRFHSRRRTPRVQVKIKKFEDYEKDLAPLMKFLTDRGRLPAKGELKQETELKSLFGSINRAFKLIQSATNEDDWEQIAKRRSEDLLVYFALANFSKRPKFKLLDTSLQQDIKAFFGSYKKGCEQADKLLFSLGQEGVLESQCKQSTIGKFVPDGLYVHMSALDDLDILLRLYEGCASRTVGRMDGATLVKFHTKKPKISYLFYPDFDSDPHPALHSSVRIDLRDLHVKSSDYSESLNPPILHRKETFVSPDYPHYEKFKALTAEEEQLGLLNDSRTIGNKHGWQIRLQEYNLTVTQDHKIASN